MCGVKTAKRGCSSSWTTVLSTSWYVHSIILFCKLLFSWIEFDDFLKKFQETYNSRLRERYGDDPSTHPDFDPDLWMEVGSSGGPETNQVYGLSNTMAENLWSARSVSTVGALHQYRAPSLRSSWPWNNNMNNSRWIMISFVKWSWRLDQGWVMIHVQHLFDRTVPETISLLLLLQLCCYSSLILFFKHIKFVMNIWMNII
jgi:hypothetical protein